MIRRTIVISVLALASIAGARYLLNKGLVPVERESHADQKAREAEQSIKAKEAEERREAEMLLHCLAVAEAEYVADLDREYNNARVHATFGRDRRVDVNPEVHHRLESRKETSANTCQKEYGHPPAPSP